MARWTISSQLGVHHTTVQRVLQHAGVESKALAPRPSMADPFVPFIVEQLEKFAATVTIPLPPGDHRDLVFVPHALSTYDALKKDSTDGH